MASASQNCCLSDPNYAVICSFLDQFGELLGLPDLTFKDVQNYLEDTRNLNDELLNILVRLMRRTGQKITFEKWQKGLIKFCHKYSQFDAWELERFGFKNSNLALKLRILKNLLEAQFDGFAKFKEKVNEKTAEDLRFQPLGRDRAGLAYWYLLDKELNLLVYQEEPDNSGNEGWKLVCQTREELACLISKLSTGSPFIKDEDSRSSTPSTTASNEKDVKPNIGEIKEEKLIFQGECEPEEKDEADNSRREDGVSEKIKTEEESAIDHEKVKGGEEVKVEDDVKVKVEPGIQATECKEEAEDKVEKDAVVKDEEAEFQEEENNADNEDGEDKIDVKKGKDSFEERKDEIQDSGGTAPETNISVVSEDVEEKESIDYGCGDAAVAKETDDTPVANESLDSSVSKHDGASGDKNGSVAKETSSKIDQSNDAVDEDAKTSDENLALEDKERKKDENNKEVEEKDLEMAADGGNLPGEGSDKHEPEETEGAASSLGDVKDKTEEKCKSGDGGDASKGADTENVDEETTEGERESPEIGKGHENKKVSEDDPNGGSDLKDSLQQTPCDVAEELSEGDVGKTEEKETDEKDSVGDGKKVGASEEETGSRAVEEKSDVVEMDETVDGDGGGCLKEKDQEEEAKDSEGRPDTKTRDTGEEKAEADQRVDEIDEERKKQRADIEKVEADDENVEADDKSVEADDRVEDEKEAVEIPEGDGSGGCDGGGGKNEEKEMSECSDGKEDGKEAKRDRCGGDIETLNVVELSPKGPGEEQDGKNRKGRNGKRKGKRKASDVRKEDEGIPNEKQITLKEPSGPSEEEEDGKMEKGENGRTGKGKAEKDDAGSEEGEKEGSGKEDADQPSPEKEVKENGECGDEKGSEVVEDEVQIAGNDNQDSSQAEKKDGDTGAVEKDGEQRRGRKRPRKQELIPIDTENLRRSSRQRKRPNILEDLENVPPVKVIKSRASPKSPQKSPQKANRKAAATVTLESSDDDIPLSQVRKKGKGKGKRKSKKKKKDDEDYEEVEEEPEEEEETTSKKGKKNRKRKPESDGDFVLSKKKGKQGKSIKSRGKKRKNQDSSSADVESSEDSEFAELLHLQQESESELSFGENSYDEFACEENDPNFTPKLGRNYKRAMSIVGKGVSDEPVVVGDDKPCTKCHKYDHPELILLCDKCDAGYHTTCTLPPLLLVPEGDWFCPPCEHAKLLDKLQFKLKDLDKQLKENERLVKRKERLAFVNISLDNILLKQEEEEEPQHHKKKKKKKKKEKSHHRSSGLRPRFIEETEESEEDDEWLYTRSTRERKTVNYNFTDYDQMINSAIADDAEEEYDPAALDVPVEKPKKEVKKKTAKSRGKDMENILAMQETEDCFQEFEQKKDEEKDSEKDSEESEKDGGDEVKEEEEYEGRPPPVVKRTPKPRLTNLDDYEEGDDSEEYRATEDSVDEEEEEASLSDVVSEESDYKWQSVKSHRRQPRNKRGKRSNRWQDYVVDNFVVEESESDYSDDGVRRSRRRAAAKKPVKYNESSDTDVSAPVITTSKKKRRVHESEEDYTASEKSSSSYSEPEVDVVETEDDTPVKKRKRYEEDSDFEDHIRVKPLSRFQRHSAAMATKFSRLKATVKCKARRRSYQRMVSDSEEEESKSESSESVTEESDKESSPSKPKAKRRNVIKSSSEDSENEGESETDEKSAKKSEEPKSTKKSRTLKSESESENEAPRVKKMNGHREKSSVAVQGSFDDVMKSAGFKEAFLEGAGVSEDEEIANSDLSDVSDLVSYIDQH
ncbi:remodeling and spacing factor 1-like [Lineus longissimus]|uniref:remodeling and spacing factor 1-like n=1 Tax=Lineus longissimus TaxID=88925 RepID=UPI002B4E9910